MSMANLEIDQAAGSNDAWFVRRSAAAPQDGLAALFRLMGVAEPAPHATAQITTRRVRAGVALFHEGTCAQAVYFIAVGTFKLMHTAEDGYEQVLGFAGRAEMLGYDALCQRAYPTTAVALEDSTVYALPVADLFGLSARVPALGRVLHLAASRQLLHQVEIAHLMAAVSAEVRLARFLLQFSDHMAERGQSPRRLYLRMSRRDIASHLGVAHETVSRSFGALANWGCVAVNNREVEILDRERLLACASNTRGLVHARRGGAAEGAGLARPRAACG
ncbi:MAG TPA: Crp/Fnr family transcriptional regulator [Burkholderiaceae bacterium]|jgi:CRP/FNR family transcriptional regulator|nr:Crp/Fnr family transcriptional regulator [Burkholderiaceae bacterium]